MSQIKIDSRKDFLKLLNNKIFSKVFVLSGTNSFEKSGAKKLLTKSLNKDQKSFIYLKKSKEPNLNELLKIKYFFDKFKPKILLAIGGGSVIDYAKILCATKIDETIKKKIANNKNLDFKKITKLLAIPTTAGSGAESTSSAVIYINKIKYSIEDERLIPDYYYLSPDLIIRSNKLIKSSAGFDAISQSIESLISLKSNNNSVKFAKESLSISLKNFIPSIKKPTLYNTYKMSLAANLSGKAINISRTTAPHAVSYPFTAHFGISHGHAVSLTIEKFLKFNYYKINYSNSNFDLNSRYKILFDIFNTKNIHQLIKKIHYLKKQSGLETDFTKLGINLKNNLPKILSGINDKRLSNNPIKIDKKDVKIILLSKNLF